MVVVVEDDMAVVSTAASSFLAHPARTAAQQMIAMRVVRCGVNMEPPVEFAKRPARQNAERVERKASGGGRQAGYEPAPTN
jgi:hypothetical protein